MRFFVSTFWTIGLFLSCGIALGQDKPKRFEVTVSNDNDVYLLRQQDRYYTNGLNVGVAYSLDKGLVSNSPKVLAFSVGHQMYNGVRNWVGEEYYLDRPFAAYLYINGTLTKFISEDKLVNYQVEFGQVGPKAQGKSIQNFIHDTFKLYHVSGWDEQIPNAFGVDASVKYLQRFANSGNQKFDISGTATVKLGTLHTNAGGSLPLRYGKIKSFDRSVYTKGHLTTKSKNDEFFVSYEPSLAYHFKIATIYEGVAEGGSYKTIYKMRHLIFKHQLGVTLAKNRSTFNFSIIQYSNELTTMNYKMHQYGQVSYALQF